MIELFFRKKLVDVWQGSEYAPVLINALNQILIS